MRRRLPGLLLASTVLLLGVLSPRLVPYDMDEFTAFHPLGCALHPLTRELNVYRERCGEYDLSPPFLPWRLPLRSYLYIGSLPVLPFAPFFFLLRDPVSVRVQGAVFLFLAFVLLRVLLGSGYVTVLAAAILFPLFAASFLIDTGPVGLSLLLLLSSLVLLRLSIEEESSWAGAAAGLALFLGVWVKIVFVVCLPGVAILAGVWAFRGGEGHPKERLWRASGALLLTFVPLCILLLMSRTQDGAYYFEVARRGKVSLEPEDVAGVARGLSAYFTDASLAVPRVLSFSSSALDYLPGLGCLALLFLGRRDVEVVAYAVASGSTFLLTGLSGRAREAHHAVFFITYLVLGMGRTLATIPRARLLPPLVILFTWGSLALRARSAEVDPRRNFEKDALLREIRATHLDERTIQLHASWGTFYIAHLFGSPREAVLFSKKFPERRDLLQTAKRNADSLGRGLLIVTRKPEALEGPVVTETLGPPLRVLREGNWTAAQYLRNETEGR